VTIKVGDKIPEGTFGVMTAEGPGGLSSDELFKGKKVVLFSVPGAFTPACSSKHLPGFIEQADALKAKGVDTIACMSVNDVFVMAAWANDQGAGDKVTLLADGNADYTKALGLELDASGFGMGTRGERFALVVDDGVVSQLHREAAASDVKASSAENILGNL
jgi:peroxiredoxin